MSWLAGTTASDLTAVAIAPDLGERYLDTVYQTNWVEDLYGDDVVARTSWKPSPSWPDCALRRRRFPGRRPSRRVVGEIGSRSSCGGKLGRR